MFRYPLPKQGTTTRPRKTKTNRRRYTARPRTFRPFLEQFEELTLPSTVTWVGGSGDWDTAANWSTGLVPGAGDDVVINAGSPTHGTTTADAVHSLSNQVPVAIAAGSLTVGGGTSQVNASVTVSGGATLTLNSATVNGSGTLTNSGTLNVTNSTLGAAVVNQGTLMNFGSDTFNGTLANATGATLWVQGNGTVGSAALTSATGFTNDGTLRVESIDSTYSETIALGSGSTLTNAADGTLLVNQGTGGSRNLTGNLTNQGTVAVAAGVTLPETGTSPTFTQAGGTFAVGAGGLFYVNGGAINFTGGAVSGTVFGIGGVTLNVTAGVTTPSTVYLNDGTLVNNLSPAVTVWLQGNATFGNSSTSLSGNATNAGTLRLESANGTYSVSLNTGGFTLTNTGVIAVGQGTGGGRALSGNLTNPGVITVTAAGTTFTGNLANSGQVSVDSNASLSIQNGTYTAAGGTITGPAVLNSDTIRETASPPTPSTLVLVNYATLATDNLAGYTLWMQGDSIGGNLTLTTPGSFTNHGTIRLESADSTYRSDIALGGGGTLTNAADGTLPFNQGSGGSRTLSGNLTNQGTVTVGAGAILVLNGTLTNFGAGTLTGGTYNVSGTFQFPGAAITTNAATIVLDGASSQIMDQSSNNALANFATNAAAGSFTIQNGRNFTAATAFSNAGSLAVGSGNGTLAITPAALTITAADRSKVYGAALPALTVSYSGFVNGDTAASLTTPVTVTTTATAASPVGSYPITPSGAASPNYTITFVSGTLAITPAALAVTANDASKVYGQANPAFSASYTGFVNGDTLASLGGTLSFSTSATAASPVGAYTITPSGLTSGNYNIIFANGTLSITAAPLMVTANDASKVYGQANPTFSASYSGFVNGDTPASLSGTLSFSTPATAASPVGSYAVTPSGLTSGNYAITFVAGTLSVTPAALTVTANDATKVYGQVNPTFSASYAGFVNGDGPGSLGGTLGFTTSATAASPVGAYAVTPGGLTSGNYSITFVNGTLSITPAALTITANNQTMVYSGTPPTLTASYSGFVNGDTPASLTTPPTVTTTATASSHVGTYPITAGGAAGANYSITYVAGILTVTPAALTITADNQSKVYGAPVPTLTVSYSGLTNGDTPASLTTAPTVTTTATAASHVTGNPYAITVSGAADPDYAISYVAGTLTVTPAPLIITADNQTMVYGGTLPALTAGYAGFVNGDTAASLTTPPTLSTTATSTSPVGAYPITAGGAADPDYSISYVAGTLTITQAASATAVRSSLNPSVTGQAVTFTATVSAVAPGSGGPTGTVTFMDGTTVLGSGTLGNGGTATFTTPTLTVGMHSITVVYAGDSNFSGSTSPALIQAVNSNSAVPVVTGISPFSGTTAGGTVVTITGVGFTGVTAVTFGTVAATHVTFISDSQITATAPVHAAGLVDVQVVTPNGVSATNSADLFNYLAPLVVSTGVGHGTTAGGTTITISGAYFVGVTRVLFGTVPAASFMVVSDTEIVAVTPVHFAGVVNIQVANAGAISSINVHDQFTFLAPEVAVASPNTGSTAGGTVVTITGSHFFSVTAVRFGTVPAASFTVVSPGEIIATTPAHLGGPVDVRVANAGAVSQTSLADVFTFEAPVVTGVSPNVGPTLGGTVVTITGTNFIAVTAVHFGATPATLFTVVSPTQITATAPPHAAGAVDVRVVNAGATSVVTGSDRFTYLVLAVTGVSPNSGSTAGGAVVTITGGHFTGVSQVLFGVMPATSFTVVSDTQIRATAPAHYAGAVDVHVVNGGVTSPVTAGDRFTYDAPAVLGVNPNTGVITGGTVVTITGSNFIGVTAVHFGATAATSFTVVSPTQITATAPAHAAGAVDVRVSNAGTDSAITTADQFTYLQGTGPGGPGAHSPRTPGDLAGDPGEVNGEAGTGGSRTEVPAGRSAGSATTGVAPAADVRAATLAGADVENFFSTAPGLLGLGLDLWPADLLPANRTAATDALFAPE